MNNLIDSPAAPTTPPKPAEHHQVWTMHMRAETATFFLVFFFSLHIIFFAELNWIELPHAHSAAAASGRGLYGWGYPGGSTETTLHWWCTPQTQQNEQYSAMDDCWGGIS